MGRSSFCAVTVIYISIIGLTRATRDVYDVYVVQHPENASVAYSSEVELQCKFSDAVNCGWEHNGSPTSIMEGYSSTFNRYKYGTGKSTKDCSLLISVFIDLDIGKWICKATSEYHEPIYSKPAWLFSSTTTTRNIMVVQHPENMSIPLHTTVLLPCKFNHEVNCAWEHNGITQHFYFYSPRSNRYDISDGEYTMDCSLRIPFFTIYDSGEWICKMKSYSRSTISSRSAWLFPTNYYIKIDEEPPSAAEFKLGQEVILQCKFNTTTSCGWKQNQETIYISSYSGKYTYNNSDGDNTRDCSLKIKTFNVTDIATWRCYTALGMHETVQYSRLASITAESPIAYIGIMQNPKHQTVNIGEHVILDCKFNISVFCSWVQLNRTTIHSIDENPHYWFLDSHVTKTDCSLRINSVQLIDEGLWTCEGKFNDLSLASTMAAYLTVQDDKLESNKNATKLNLTDVSRLELNFTCKFNTPVNCYWFYRENSYLEDFTLSKIMANTTDCSISLSKTWWHEGALIHCQGISDETNEVVTSIELEVDNGPSEEIIIKQSILEGPENITVKYGQSVTLMCKFRDPVKCIWFLGDELRYIDDVMRVKNYRVPHIGLASTDCSLTIRAVQNCDIGHWKCQEQPQKYKHLMRGLFTYSKLISAGAWITVQKMPQDPELISENGIVTNMTITNLELTGDFHCISKDGNPPANLQWSLNGDLVDGNKKITVADEFMYTAKLYWDPDIKVQANDELLCVADHIEYDNVKYVKVGIVTSNLPRQSAVLKNPTIMHKNDTILSGQRVNQSVSLDTFDDLVCRVESRDTKQTLFWEYAGKRYNGIQEERLTEAGTVELWLQWNNTIHLQGNDTNVTCTTELVMAPQHTSVQILKSTHQNEASEESSEGNGKLAVTLTCIFLSLGLIAIISFTIYRFKARKIVDQPFMLMDHETDLLKQSDDMR